MARKKNQTPPAESPTPAPLEGLDAFASAPPADPGFRPLTADELAVAKEADDVMKAMGRVPEATAFLREIILRSDSVQIPTKLEAAEAYLKSHGDLDEELQEVVFGIMNHEPADMRARVRAARLLLGVV